MELGKLVVSYQKPKGATETEITKEEESSKLPYSPVFHHHFGRSPCAPIW